MSGENIAAVVIDAVFCKKCLRVVIDEYKEKGPENPGPSDTPGKPSSLLPFIFLEL
jgi:hypothetical protein